MSEKKLTLAMAIRLIKEGDKVAGANILANLLTTNPNNEVAWLWLAFCTDAKKRKAYCLERALQINPNRMEAQQALNELALSLKPSDEISLNNLRETIDPAPADRDEHVPISSLPQNGITENLNTKLKTAIDLVKAGKRAEGENILSYLLTIDPHIEEAWHWLFICAETDRQRIYCLEKILEINPLRTDIQLLIEEAFKLNPKQKSQNAEEVLADKETKDKINARAKNTTKVKAKAMGKTESKAGGRTRVISEPKNKSEAKTRKQQLAKGGADVQAANKDPKRSNPQNSNTEEKPLSFTSANGKNISTRIAIPFKEPTYIIIRPEDNLFAERKDRPHKLPQVEGNGSSLFIDGVRINSFSKPRCLKMGQILDHVLCDLCDFFSSEECVFQDDPFLFEDVVSLAAGRRNQQEFQHKLRQQTAIRAIYNELKAHGRPLHYSILAMMVAKRHPQLEITALGVLRTMTHHPDIFEAQGNGVYHCKPRK